MADLDEMTLGMVFDMLTELSNDQCQDEYASDATQEDCDAF